MSSINTKNGSIDIDPSREYIYSTMDNNSIQLHRYSLNEPNLSYLSRIPVVRTWDGSTVNPDNLLLYNGGNNILLSDSNSYDSILNMNIERGIVMDKKSIHKSFGGRNPENVTFKVNKFDYNSHSDTAQYDHYAIGINSNHVMRFDLTTGNLAHVKAYEKNPYFTTIVTDSNGNVIIGDESGAIRIYPEIGKKAAKCWVGLGDEINDIKISSKGDLVATTLSYFIFLPDFIRKGTVEKYYIGKIGKKVSCYLDIENSPVKNAQFSPDEDTIVFSIGKYLFHWKISHLVSGEKEFSVYEADKPIIQHKFTAGQFVLADKLIKFSTYKTKD